MVGADATTTLEGSFNAWDGAPNALAAVRPDWTWLWLNQAARRLLLAPPDLSRMAPLTDLLVDDDALAQFKAGFLKQGTARGVVMPTRTEGAPGRVALNAWRASQDSQAPVMLSLAPADVVTDAVRHSAVFERAPFALALSALPQRRLVAVNQAFTEYFGRTKEELIGKTGVEAGLVKPEDQKEVFAEFTRTGQVRNYRCQLQVKSGAQRWFLVNVLPVSIEGQPHVLTVLHDVHERLEAERALAEREREATERTRQLAAVLDAVADAVLVYDGQGRVVRSNGMADALVQLSEEDRAKSPQQRAARWTWRSPDGQDLRPEELPLARVLATGQPVRDVVVGRVATGEDTRWFSVSVLPYANPDGGGGVVASFSDVTARLNAERTAAAERQLHQSIIDGTPSLVLAFDKDGRVLRVNDSAAAMLGSPRESLIGKRLQDGVMPEHAAVFVSGNARVVSSGRAETAEVDVHVGGHNRTVIASWHPLRDAQGAIYGAATVTTDITNQKRVEAELRQSEAAARKAQAELEQAIAVAARTEEKFRQAQKLEAIGRLAGGVAHDFNNLLTVILGGSEELYAQLNEADPLRDLAREIETAGRRAEALTRQLLAFSRRQVMEPRVVDVNQLVTGAEKMLRRVIGEDVEFTLLLSSRPRLCRLDPGQLEQVLMNLVVNSRDAMPDGGRLTIETASMVLDEEYVATHPGAVLGRHVMVSVSDTGTGMSRETLSRLFEPFFTTKAVGHGTGLGLATVLGIVQQSGGTIWAYSEPGQGTTFRIYFPEVVAEGPDAPPPSLVPPSRRGGTEAILLVEDEELVRRTVSSMLRRAGYHVIECANGGEALLTCEQHGGTIHLMLTDVVMPKLNGRKLAERLRQLRPDMRVIFMSGYTENAIVHHGVLDSGIDFIPKPITADALLAKVRLVLDRAADHKSEPPPGGGRSS